jgi:predicted Zn-ribbon and HTH transcriptional regulator
MPENGTPVFGDLSGAEPQPVQLQGGIVILRPYGCTRCGNAFWTEDDPVRRLPPGRHPCPYCHEESRVVA